MTTIQIRLLGSFDIRIAGQKPLNLPKRVRALLAWLAFNEGNTVARDAASALLWGNRSQRQANASLSQALYVLRKSLDGAADVLEADNETLRLSSKNLDVDVQEFLRLAHSSEYSDLSAAQMLYTGEFLAGFPALTSEFDEWRNSERRRLHNEASGVATRLLSLCEKRGDAVEVVVKAQRLQELEPYSEIATRSLMLHRTLTGDRIGALREFNQLRERLEADLGVPPEPETLSVFDEVRMASLRQTDPDTAPDLPEKPSIAVLALHASGTADEQQYFADGIVEEIIAALSRVRWLFVISRSSSFTWRGPETDLTEVGRRLGVRYILSAGVRQAGNQLRIAGRMIDARNGALLWSESFEGSRDNVFELQDRVAACVVGAVAPRVEEAEIARTKRKSTERLDAYDSYLRGLSALHSWQRESNSTAIRCFRQATRQDPNFAAAFGFEARCYSQQKACGWVTDYPAVVTAVRVAAERAVDLGQDDAVALSTAGIGLAFVANDVAFGADLISQSLELNPNLANAWLFSGWVNTWLGKPEMAIDHIARAMRLNPRDPEAAMMYGAMGYAHFVADNYGEAARWAEKSIRNRPSYLIACCILAASKAMLGDRTSSEQLVGHIRQIDPDLRVSKLLELYPIQRKEDRARWAKGLMLAGLGV